MALPTMASGMGWTYLMEKIPIKDNKKATTATAEKEVESTTSSVS
jgi:hypothetical protein